MIRKLSLLAGGLFILNVALAQEPMTKRGTLILPHKGDWGVGFDAVPIVKYAGNIFHDSNNNANISINTPLSVTARHMRKDNLAYRLTFKYAFSSVKTDTLVPKEGSTNTNEQVADETTENSMYELLGFGLQRYIGKARIRGYYGGEGYFTGRSGNTKYNFGNQLTAQSTTQTRTIQVKQGSTAGFGLRAFLGIEVFIGAKISLAAEYGFSPLNISVTGENEIKTQSWDGSVVKTETKTTEGRVSSFNAGTDNNNGSISVLFYFSR